MGQHRGIHDELLFSNYYDFRNTIRALQRASRNESQIPTRELVIHYANFSINRDVGTDENALGTLRAQQ